MQVFDVLRRPIITEKTTLLQEEDRYAFEVALWANKTQVKEAVERAFDVTVTSVNMIKVHGKRKRYGPRQVKQTSRKKAIVSLRPGDRIEVFEGG